MSYSTIYWDLDDDPDGNVAHCLEHGVTKEEVEEVFARPIDGDNSESSGRPILFGHTTTGKHLVVVFEEVDSDSAYPITAYEVPERSTE